MVDGDGIRHACAGSLIEASSCCLIQCEGLSSIDLTQMMVEFGYLSLFADMPKTGQSLGAVIVLIVVIAWQSTPLIWGV